MSIRGKISLAAMAVAALVMAGCSSAPLPDASDNSWSAVEQRANAEGLVTFYSVSPEVMTDPLIKAFNEKYPKIKVNFLKGGTELPAKVSAEIQARAEGADIFLYSGSVWHSENESELESLSDLPALQNLSADGWISDGTIPISSYVPMGIIAWNTSIFPDGFQDWDDLLDQDVKGKLGTRESVDPVVASYLEFLQNVNGSQYLTGLASNEPTFYSSSVPMTQAVASGEIGVTNITVPSVLNDLKAKGAPIEWTIPKETWATPYVISLVKNAKHKNASEVFLNFMFSPEGQAAFNGSENGASVLPDIAGALDLSSHQVSYLDPAVTTPEAVQDWAVKFDTIFR